MNTFINTYFLAETPPGGLMDNPVTSIGFIVLMIVIFYFMLIRPQKKQAKEETNMRNSVEVGDEIITRGGVVGFVVSIKEDTLVLETGGDRSKIRIKRWAIQSNETIHEMKEQAKIEKASKKKED